MSRNIFAKIGLFVSIGLLIIDSFGLGNLNTFGLAIMGMLYLIFVIFVIYPLYYFGFKLQGGYTK